MRSSCDVSCIAVIISIVIVAESTLRRLRLSMP